MPPVPRFLSRPDGLLFSSRLLSPPCHCQRGLASPLQYVLIGSTEVEKAREGGEEGGVEEEEEGDISTAALIALMFIAAPSSFALTLWKRVPLKIIKR